MTPQEEMRLVKLASGGDKGAFERLVLENQRNVYNLALKLMKNPEDAFDAAQEAFLKAYLKLKDFRGDSRFSAWLYRLTYNTCIDLLRKSQRAAVVSLTRDTEDEDGQSTDIADTAPSPEEQCEARETRDIVRREMERLPEEQYRILVMRELAGMSYDEIAKTAGISEGTVKSRIFRARSRLAQALKKSGTFSDYQRQKDRSEVTGDENM